MSGCAAIVVYPDHLGLERELIVDFGCAESSISRMELMAVIKTLRWIRENRPWTGVSRVQIITDSRYVKENIARAAGWRKNGWSNRAGEPIENPDLWKEFLSGYSRVGMTVTIEWTHGKKSPLLKEIDKAAKAAALRGGPDTDRGYSRGAISRSELKGVSATKFNADGQVAIIKIYRKTVMRRTNGQNKVRFDLYSVAEGTFIDSCYAYADPDLAHMLHRQHMYKVRFNEDRDYPRIVGMIEEVVRDGRSAAS